MTVNVTPYFENTTQQAYYNNEGVLRAYYIRPVDGYVLHSNTLDEIVVDPETLEETGEVILGYTAGTVSVGYNYDFAANSREIYAVLRSSVDENYIFGGGDEPEHEVM